MSDEIKNNSVDEDVEINSSTTEKNRDEKDIKIEELEIKLKDGEDKYIRVFAEFENYKKRLEKEKYQAISFASEKFATELLPVLDNLQMAIQSVKTTPDIDKLTEGVELTLKNFLSTLEKNNIEAISTEDGFNPNFHEAVMKVDNADYKSGEIVQVLQNGYKLKDRVLRATMVSVAN